VIHCSEHAPLSRGVPRDRAGRRSEERLLERRNVRAGRSERAPWFDRGEPGFRLIVEVLSPSTEDHDRGRKFAHYRTLPSLVEYLVVAQDRPYVERFFREPGNHESPDPRWVLTEASRLEGVIHLLSVDAVLSLREVYDKVELAPG